MKSSACPSARPSSAPGVFLRALGLSLALHALALGLLGRFNPADESGSVAGLLQASLAPAPRTASSAAAETPRAENFKPPRSHPQPQPVTRPAPAESLLRSEETASGRAVSPAPTFANAAPAGPVPETVSAPSGRGGAASVSASAYADASPRSDGLGEAGGPDASGLRQYRLALAREARRLRQYPAAARREGWSGTVEVRIDVAAGNGLRLAMLSRSSGQAVLDAAAVDMLNAAAARAPLPEALRGRDFSVLLPVIFDVGEE